MTGCQHVAPSPGQSMCQCEHRRIELEMTVALLSTHIARLEERGAVTTYAKDNGLAGVPCVHGPDCGGRGPECEPAF